MILQASQPERWLMFALAIAGIGFSIFTLYKGKKISLQEKGLPFFIGFLGLMEFISLITNAFGRYNLAKSFLTSGFFSLIVGVLLIWTVRLINEALSLASEAYKDQDKKVVYINFEKVGKRVSPVFYLLLTIGWLILFGRNFYAYKILTEPIVDFLSMERNIGNNTFTIQSILFFFGILILSGLTSKIVSFFASGNFHSPGTTTGKKTGIGSWLLLIRIAIMSIGVFFAFAVAGIPLDKLAIILGALSVGIGFGLQTLINNLVSGLIIAFEKPINVGDIVEIGGQTGTMKSIGFRSSVISTPEGSDVIIPNGELLSQHLINWTMTDSRRRVNIQVGVAYGSNLESVVKALQELMEADDRILKFPAPAVMVKEFNSSSIDLSLFFWVGHFNTAFQLKSDMMLAIDIKFKELGIEIPFPQQDLHIKTMVKHEGS
jgi:small-conductance mechanosensitive channel